MNTQELFQEYVNTKKKYIDLRLNQRGGEHTYTEEQKNEIIKVYKSARKPKGVLSRQPRSTVIESLERAFKKAVEIATGSQEDKEQNALAVILEIFDKTDVKYVVNVDPGTLEEFSNTKKDTLDIQAAKDAAQILIQEAIEEKEAEIKAEELKVQAAKDAAKRKAKERAATQEAEIKAAEIKAAEIAAEQERIAMEALQELQEEDAANKQAEAQVVPKLSHESPYSRKSNKDAIEEARTAEAPAPAPQIVQHPQANTTVV